MLTYLWNASYTFFVSLTVAILTILAMVGGACMLFSRKAATEFGSDLPSGLDFCAHWGLWGILGVWLGYLAVAAGLYFVEHQRISIPILLIAFVPAFLYMMILNLSVYGMWSQMFFRLSGG